MRDPSRTLPMLKSFLKQILINLLGTVFSEVELSIEGR
jgi:hypothetical protein